MGCSPLGFRRGSTELQALPAALYVGRRLFSLIGILAQQDRSCFPSSRESQAECQLVRNSFPASWSQEGAGWGKRMTASCPSVADRRLKGRGEAQSWACQKDPGERWQHFPGTSLRASPRNIPTPWGYCWGLVPTSHLPQPVCAESCSKGFALGREAVRAKHERSSWEEW